MQAASMDWMSAVPIGVSLIAMKMLPRDRDKFSCPTIGKVYLLKYLNHV